MVLAVAAIAAALVAITADGYRINKVDLHDPGIWITRQPGARGETVGRVNSEIGNRIDAALTDSVQDVLQSGSAVFLKGADRLTSVDVKRAGTAGQPTAGVASSQVGLGGATLAVLERGSAGRLRIVDATQFKEASFKGKPTAAGIQAMDVGVDGFVHAVSGDTVRVYAPDGREVSSSDLGRRPRQPKVTAVGRDSIVLDEATNALILAGGSRVALAAYGKGAHLQLPSARDSRNIVVVETDSSLLEVGLDNGKVTSVKGAGTGGATRPVRLNGCSYGAWGTTGALLSDCEGRDPAKGNVAAGRLVFRTNRDKVYVNNTDTGEALTLDVKRNGHVTSQSWDEALRPQEERRDDPDADKKLTSSNEDKSNKPATAVPIAVGTRPGRPRTIRVIGTPGVVGTHVKEVGVPGGSGGTAGIGLNGQTVAFTPASDSSSGSSSFSYTVASGGNVDSNTITVRVHPLATNGAPLVGTTTLTMLEGTTASVNVLDKAEDPDGDAVLLVDVGGAGGLGQPSFRPNGLVTITALKADPNPYKVPLVIHDEQGLAPATPPILQVEVKRPDELNPSARNDFVTGFVDREIVVRPLANDKPSGLLRLSSVTPPADGSIQVRDRSDEVVRLVTSKASGDAPFVVEYEAAWDDTGKSAKGRILIDVKPTTPDKPPAIGRDDLVLTAGVPVINPVLANDADPNGDVLSISGVEVDPTLGLKVEVLKRQYLRVTAQRPIPIRQPAAFKYLVTDGTSTARGVVIVHGLDATTDRAPLVTDDALSLRVGRIGTSRVLDNDVDPEGGPLTVDQATDPDTGAVAPLTCIDAAGEDCPPGTAFVSGDRIRVIATTTPARLTIAYTALDAGGSKGGARLVVTVVDGENNTPQPPPVEVRTVLGRPIDIPIPVGASDPDGDVVAFTGLQSQPQRGVISEPDRTGLVEGAKGKREPALRNALRYVPKTTGTDVFTYAVTDPSGLVGIGTILVGISAPAANGVPVAVADTAEVVPGGTITFDVLANDSDPDEDPIRMVKSPSEVPKGATLDLRRQLIVVRGNSGWTDGTLKVPYRITDDHDQTSDSTLTVRVNAKVVSKPPIAIDDILAPVAPGDPVKVNVLDNDFDADGDVAMYAVAYDPPKSPAGFTVQKQSALLSFRMPNDAVQIRYTVTDTRRKQSASAIVMVPVKPQTQLKTTPDAADVAPGESVDVFVTRNDEPNGRVKLDTAYDAIGGTVKVDGDHATFTALSQAANPPAVGGFKYKVLLEGSNPPATAVGIATIAIKSKENNPPTLSSLNVDLAAGEKKQIDLGSTVTDPDTADEFKFKAPTSSAAAVKASQNGDTLTLEADKGAFKAVAGSPVVIAVSGEDTGTPPKPATSQVLVRILGNPKPLPIANPDELNEPVRKKQGPVEIPVLSNDVGDELRVTAVSTIESGRGSAAASSGGKAVVYTPPAQGSEFFGRVTFTYTVADDIDEDGRPQTAAVTVNVIDIPAKPGKPAATNTASRQTTLSWTFPESDKHGDTIDHFEVTGDHNFSQRCDGTTCLLTKLTNGEDYRFAVKACGVKTAPDCSAASDPSDVVGPNKAPDEPEFGELVELDKKLTVNWTQPARTEDSGSAPTKYLLTLSPGSQVTTAADVRMYTFEPVTNGVDYKVTIVAVNRGDGANEFKSNPVESPLLRPYDVPIWGSAPPVGKDLGNGTLEVTWTAPNPNGRPIESYEVKLLRNGSTYNTQVVNDGSATRTTFPGTAVGNDNYTFTITATNLRGVSGVSGPSVAVKAAGPPLPIGSVTAAEGDRTATLTFTAPDNQGSEITHYTVSTAPASSQPATFSGPRSGQVTLTVSSLTNGTAYRFQVSACNASAGTKKCGDPSPQSNPVTPFGPPGSPGVSGSTSGQGDTAARWSWSVPNANGKAIIRYEISVNGGGRENVGNATSFSRNFGTYSQTYTLRVWAINNEAPRSESASPGSANAATGPAPPPAHKITVAWSGTNDPCDSDTTKTCRVMNETLENFPPNATIQITCYSNQFPSGYYQHNVQTNGSGYVSRNVCEIAPSNTQFWVRSTSPAVQSNTVDP